MEEKDTTKKEEKALEQEKLLENKKPNDELSNQNIYDQYQKDQTNEAKKDETENIAQPPNLPQNTKDNNSQNVNNNNSIEKSKRHRRGKNEINDRNFRCPDCDKCYLSGPALTTHRKTKHGYGTNGEKRNRGRPKRDGLNDSTQVNPATKFNLFFNDEKRKNDSLDQTLNYKIITVDIIKENLQKIFNQCKNELFKDIPQVESYTFYPLIIENWDKESPFQEQECYRATNRVEEPSVKIQSYNLDELFFLYLKEFSKKTNKEYFWFMIKFIVLFRECINSLRKNMVKSEHQSENKQFYTQIYNAETVPEICNDFFVEFMEPYEFFGLYKYELIELIQHFCYWLYSKQYTQSHLTLLDN